MVRPRFSTRQDGTSDAIALLSIIARGAAHLRASRAIATLDVVCLRAVLTGNPDAPRNRVKRKTMNVDDCVLGGGGKLSHSLLKIASLAILVSLVT